MNRLIQLLSRLTGGSDDTEPRTNGSSAEDGEEGGKESEVRPADPPTEPMGTASVTDSATTLQTHGSHWDTVIPDDGTGTNIQDIVTETVKTGEARAGVDHNGQTVVGYVKGGSPVATMVVTIDGEIATAYPRIEGVGHEITAEALNEWEAGIEAWVGGTLGPASIRMFTTNYFEHPAEHFGGDCSVSLTLLAYDFGQADYDTVVGEDGEELDVSEFVGFRPWERGAPDDYVIRTKVKEVNQIEHGEIRGSLLRVPLFRDEEGTAFDVNLFVADHVAGEYEPAVGDTVEGACWLQAAFE